MDILAKMRELRSQYEATQQQIDTLVDSKKRMEGAYIILVELGIATGVLDEDGKPIQKAEKEEN